jgi:hypothetical protein
MTRRPGAPPILLDHEGAAESAINAMAQMDAGVPERQLTHFQNWHNPALENTISRDEQEVHDAQTQAALERRRRIPGLFDDPTSQDAEEAFLALMQRNAQERVRAMRGLPEPSRPGNEWTGERRLPSPPAVYLPGDLDRGLSNPNTANGSSFNRGDDTPISLSGARGSRTLRRFSLPTSSTPDDNDDHQIDAYEALNTTYPLFAPLDDAGPYPIEDMFDNDDNHSFEEEEDDSAAETLYPNPGPGTFGMLGPGYEPWWPTRPLRGALPDTDREQTNIADTADSPYEVVGSPDYTLGPASPTTTGLEYTTRARAEVDGQLLLDSDLGRRLIGGIDHNSVWTHHMPPDRRRQREDDDEDQDRNEEDGDVDRRPVRRLRMDEESRPGPSEGIQQRIRRSIPVESLLSGSGTGTGDRDTRRNGLVFDAESYINPDL